MRIRRVLVVGAKEDSLGEAIQKALSGKGILSKTAGISGEDIELDALSSVRISQVFSGDDFTDVVCTVGVNRESYPGSDGWTARFAADHLVNAIAPMRILDGFLEHIRRTQPYAPTHHFVAISSNSAAIARSRSLGYCASKAALSMALRTAGRYMATPEARGLYGHVAVWGVEPGWILGTPMSREVSTRLLGEDEINEMQINRFHRMPGILGITKEYVAEFIACNLLHGGDMVNSSIFRLDAGDQ